MLLANPKQVMEDGRPSRSIDWISVILLSNKGQDYKKLRMNVIMMSLSEYFIVFHSRPKFKILSFAGFANLRRAFVGIVVSSLCV